MVRIKGCVAGGCSGRNGARSASLHRFPYNRPEILRQWVKFVHQTRKSWSGPTKCSMLCSLHFTEDSFPFKYRFLESCGETVKRKCLLPDAVPTKRLSTTPKPGSGTSTCSTPKKPRRAFLKREVQR
ncbi:peroxynitrite isomerase THAP4-like, partial [Saccostrea cucullata]|uniref:peroxynitrite isomerase THAP4-like n=1 Tax=Saccostrea cuccullata TaxID=36930 RepID=UPI002ED62A0B